MRVSGAVLNISSNDLAVVLNTVNQAKAALRKMQQDSGSTGDTLSKGAAGKQAADNASPLDTPSAPAKSTDFSTTQEEREIEQVILQLQQREKQVIAHEQAHKSVGGQYAGAATYSYTKGPDDKNYITGGEVSIDVSDESTPQKTIPKMEQVRAAALAPVDPSAQDMSVASTATQKEQNAKLQIFTEQMEAAKQAEAERISKAGGASKGASSESSLSTAYGAATSPASGGSALSVYA